MDGNAPRAAGGRHRPGDCEGGASQPLQALPRIALLDGCHRHRRLHLWGRLRQFIRFRHRVKALSKISPLSNFVKRFWRVCEWCWREFFFLSPGPAGVVSELGHELRWAGHSHGHPHRHIVLSTNSFAEAVGSIRQQLAPGRPRVASCCSGQCKLGASSSHDTRNNIIISIIDSI